MVGTVLNKRQLAIIIIVIVAIAAISTGTWMAWKSGIIFGPKYPITITDALNRTVIVEEKPQRIVSTAPSITELLFALDLGDKVVGVTDYCDYPPEVVEMRENGTIESIGGYWDPNLEKIVKLNADLVLLDAGVPAHQDLAGQLDSLNITAVALYPGKTIDEIYDNIRLVGKIAGEKNKADKLVKDMTNRINDVQSAVKDVENKSSVLFALWLNPVYTCGNDTFLSRIIYLAGGVNVFADLSGWPTVSLEEIVARKPDVILVTATMMGEEPEDIINSLKNDALWNSTPAVQNNKVYILIGQGENIFLRPSVRVVEAVELLARILYPDIFHTTEIPNVIGDNYTDYLPSTFLTAVFTTSTLPVYAYN